MQNKKRKLNRVATFLLTLIVCLLLAAIILAAIHLRQKPQSASSAKSSAISSSTVAKTSGAASSYSAAVLRKLTAQGGLLMLVNKTNKLSSDYTPDLVTIPSKYYVSSGKDRDFDKRAAPYLEKMINAGRAAGYNLVIYSGYRTFAYQQNNFDRHVKEYEAEGKTSAQATALSAKLVAPPGTSEHETGLACDIVSSEYNAVINQKKTGLVATDFDKRPEFKWLVNNCAKYGFILRYLKNKVNVTKYEYESWHFRFVGVNDAKKIMKSGLCLEEYVANFKK